MKVLLTNDDGIHSGGLNELARELMNCCELFVVAPRSEQSGISQAITFLRPLFPLRLPQGDRPDSFEFDGYTIDGTPADCVRLSLFDLCPWKPDLIISGINGGLNAGVNVGYSGTVGAALTAASFGIRTMAISLEYNTQMDFASAAQIAIPLIEQFGSLDLPKTVVNVNIPTAALEREPEIVVVPAETNLLGYHFEKGADPKGRPYYWANNKPDPEPSPFETDCQALRAGKISVTPISFDLNQPNQIATLKSVSKQHEPETQASE